MFARLTTTTALIGVIKHVGGAICSGYFGIFDSRVFGKGVEAAVEYIAA